MTDDYTLAYGTHATPGDGRCAMEWVAHLAGEPHSDEPACVSPVLRALCISLNDGLADGPRQRLRPFLARTIGTAGDGLDPARSWMALDWLARTYAPAWLTLAGLPAPAAALAAAPAVLDGAALRTLHPLLADARQATRTARLRAFGGPSGWAAAVAGGRSGREAAWACAGAAAWSAARVALGDADTPFAAQGADRVRARVRAVAGDAAAIAVRRVADDNVCGAPRRAGAVDQALGETLSSLADSALELLGRMLPTVALPGPPAVVAPAAVAGSPVAR